MLTTVGVLMVLKMGTKCGSKRDRMKTFLTDMGARDNTALTDSVITPNTAHVIPTITTQSPHKTKHRDVSYVFISCMLCREHVNVYWIFPCQINTAADITTLDFNETL
jgi:hypothetical protein